MTYDVVQLHELVAITAATLDGEVPDEDQDIVQEYVNGLIVWQLEDVTTMQNHR